MKTHKSRTWMEKSSRPTPRPACAPRRRPPEYSPARRGRVPARGLSGEVRLHGLKTKLPRFATRAFFSWRHTHCTVDHSTASSATHRTDQRPSTRRAASAQQSGGSGRSRSAAAQLSPDPNHLIFYGGCNLGTGQSLSCKLKKWIRYFPAVRS